MNKEELLHELSEKIYSGELSRDEVFAQLGSTPVAPAVGGEPKSGIKFSVTTLLYFLGAAIVIIGIVIFVSQIWSDIGSFGRILVTLGLGLMFTAIGSVLHKSKPGDMIGSVFHTIGGVLVPSGALVTLSELSVNSTSVWPVTVTFAVITLFYVLLDYAQKTSILTFFAVGNATTFLYLLVTAMVGDSFYYHGDLYAYLTMVVGASYILLAHSFREGRNARLSPVFNFFGSIALLGAAFSRVFDSGIWQALYFFLVFGCLYLAVRLKSRSVLVVATGFLIAHISYITGKYFADSVGWPIALVFLGMLFIALGYGSITISKKYIQN